MSTIGNFFSSFWDILSGQWAATGDVFELLPSLFGGLYSAITFAPSFIYGFLSLSVGISVFLGIKRLIF